MPSRNEKIQQQLVALLGPFCQGCGLAGEMHLDHLLPKADGGQDVISNYTVLCRPCNTKKNAYLTLSGLRAKNRTDGEMADESRLHDYGLHGNPVVTGIPSQVINPTLDLEQTVSHEVPVNQLLVDQGTLTKRASRERKILDGIVSCINMGALTDREHGYGYTMPHFQRILRESVGVNIGASALANLLMSYEMDADPKAVSSAYWYKLREMYEGTTDNNGLPGWRPPPTIDWPENRSTWGLVGKDGLIDHRKLVNWPDGCGRV